MQRLAGMAAALVSPQLPGEMAVIQLNAFSYSCVQGTWEGGMLPLSPGRGLESRDAEVSGMIAGTCLYMSSFQLHAEKQPTPSWNI